MFNITFYNTCAAFNMIFNKHILVLKTYQTLNKNGDQFPPVRAVLTIGHPSVSGNGTLYIFQATNARPTLIDPK